MMGFQSDTQQKLFYTCLNLEKRIRKDHILRDIAKHIDFDFVYKQVEDKYGSKGNVSVPPPVILKMMLLLIFTILKTVFNEISHGVSFRDLIPDF